MNSTIEQLKADSHDWATKRRIGMECTRYLETAFHRQSKKFKELNVLADYANRPPDKLAEWTDLGSLLRFGTDEEIASIYADAIVIAEHDMEIEKAAKAE